jgi:hypothetical protein
VSLVWRCTIDILAVSLTHHCYITTVHPRIIHGLLNSRTFALATRTLLLLYAPSRFSGGSITVVLYPFAGSTVNVGGVLVVCGDAVVSRGDMNGGSSVTGCVCC